MAKISRYPAATVPADADVVPMVQGGVTKKVALSILKAFFGGGGPTPTAENDFQVASGSPLAWAEKTLADTKSILGFGEVVTSEDITTIVKCTQAEYDALSPADAGTLYIIVEA